MQGKPFIHRVKYSHRQQPKWEKTSIETLEYEWHLCLVASQSSGEPDIPQGQWNEVQPTSTRTTSHRSLISTLPQTGAFILIAMKSLAILFVFILFCAVSWSQITTPCPKECVCEEQYFSESQGVGAKVNCSGKKLKRFPGLFHK